MKFLLLSSIINKDIPAVIELIKMFESFEKCGWSINESKIRSKNPDVNQKWFKRKSKLSVNT